MHALVHNSLAHAPEIFLTVVSIFSIGFLLWFLVGLLEEERRLRARQVHGLPFTGGRVLEFEPTARMIKIAGGVRKVPWFSVPDQRSPKDAVKVRWLLLCLLVTATVALIASSVERALLYYS